MDVVTAQTMLARTKVTLFLYQDAVDALVVQGIQEYRLDTGQSVTRVTKLDLPNLNKAIGELMNRCSTLEALVNGGSVMGRPAY